MINLYKHFQGRDTFSTPWGSIQCRISGGLAQLSIGSVEQAQFLIDKHGFKVATSHIVEPRKPAPKKIEIKKSKPAPTPQPKAAPKKIVKKSASKKSS